MIALLFAAAAATVQPNMMADIRCLLASSILTQTDAAAAKTAGLFSLFYWFGRVDGRMSDAELARRLDTEAQRMTAADVKAELLRCGTEMQARGAVMEEMGKAISAAEAKRQLR